MKKTKKAFKISELPQKIIISGYNKRKIVNKSFQEISKLGSKLIKECVELEIPMSLLQEEGGFFWLNGSQQNVMIHLSSYLTDFEVLKRNTQNNLILEIGAGVGVMGTWLSKKLSGSKFLITDINEESIELGKKAFENKRVQFDVLNILDLKKELLRKVNVIIANDVFEHLTYEQQENFLRTLRRCVRKDTLVLISVPDESGYFFGRSLYKPHKGIRSVENFCMFLNQFKKFFDYRIFVLDNPALRTSLFVKTREPPLNLMRSFIEYILPESIMNKLSSFVYQKIKPVEDIPEKLEDLVALDANIWKKRTTRIFILLQKR